MPFSRISPPVGGAVLEATKKISTDTNQAERPDAQYIYTEQEKQKFRDDPDALLQFRKDLEASFNSMGEIFIRGHEVSKNAEKHMRAEMERRIGPGHVELKQRLIPTWAVGCKYPQQQCLFHLDFAANRVPLTTFTGRRLTPGDGYLEALVQPSKSANSTKI